MFDNLRPSPGYQIAGAESSSRGAENKKIKMDEALSSESPFVDGLRGPWFVSTGDDLSANPAHSPDNFAATTWDEWMRWNPSQAQSPPKALHAPNNPDNGRLYASRPHTDPQDPAFAAADAPTSSTMPFAFGQPVDALPAFNFCAPMTGPAVTAEQQISTALSTDWNANNNLASPLSLDGQSQVPPPPLSTPSLGHSPESAQMQATSSSDHSSPEDISESVNKKKRKSLVDDDGASETPTKQHPVKKTAHNMIEKRYRTNLNDKIAALRDSVPSLRVMSRPGNGDEDDDAEDLEGLTPAHKLNKATVLSKATEYIRHLEKRNKKLQDEVVSLKARAEAYDKMAMAGGPFAFQAGMLSPEATRFDSNPFPQNPDAMASHSRPQGMIQVPEAIAQLRHAAVNQPHYANQIPYTVAPGQQIPGRPVMNGPQGRNGMMGKLMVGSLAGLMLIEGFASRERSDEGTEARGLFALPLRLVSNLAASLKVPSAFAPNGLLPILKLFFIVGAFLYLIAPLFAFKPKPKQKSPAVRLAPAPPLASPVEVRRNAWLTAIQTVWVPQHSFPLELAALLLKTLKLSTRRLIGWQGYSLITGFTREQEVARVKAWDIALDAQLAGGDEEISTSRLLLTLLASGTLPDTPARLMLKALHIRLMLWDLSKNGYRSWWLWMFNGFNLKMARSYWNAAREQNRVLKNGAPRSDGAEPLAAHLAALLELDCDDVLVDAIIQRAYNLAWNNPIAQDASIDETMDSVVEDFAISSPLDALASWWSSLVLSRVLARSLDDSADSGSPAPSPPADLAVAIHTAPPASRSHARALAANAVFTAAESDIAAALDALPRPPPASPPSATCPPAALLNLIAASPVPPSVREALTMAKCVSLAAAPSAQARALAAAALAAYAPDDAALTLLSAVAAHRALRVFAGDERLAHPARAGLERVARALRLWAGRDAARRLGLSRAAQAAVVGRCVAVAKELVGVRDALSDVDEGFVSDEAQGRSVGAL